MHLQKLHEICQNHTPQKAFTRNTFKARLMPIYAWPTPTISLMHSNHIFGHFEIWDHTPIPFINPYPPRGDFGATDMDSAMVLTLYCPFSNKNHIELGTGVCSMCLPSFVVSRGHLRLW